MPPRPFTYTGPLACDRQTASVLGLFRRNSAASLAVKIYWSDMVLHHVGGDERLKVFRAVAHCAPDLAVGRAPALPPPAAEGFWLQAEHSRRRSFVKQIVHSWALLSH